MWTCDSQNTLAKLSSHFCFREAVLGWLIRPFFFRCCIMQVGRNFKLYIKNYMYHIINVLTVHKCKFRRDNLPFLPLCYSSISRVYLITVLLNNPSSPQFIAFCPQIWLHMMCIFKNFSPTHDEVVTFCGPLQHWNVPSLVSIMKAGALWFTLFR